jgi:hypothetical protein
VTDSRDDPEGIRDRIASGGADAIGDLARALIDSPVFKEALGAASSASEQAQRAQRAAMSAVGLPSSDEVSRLERRMRSLSDRLESVEDQLDSVARDVSALRAQLGAGASDPLPADQKSLEVSEEG